MEPKWNQKIPKEAMSRAHNLSLDSEQQIIHDIKTRDHLDYIMTTESNNQEITKNHLEAEDKDKEDDEDDDCLLDNLAPK